MLEAVVFGGEGGTTTDGGDGGGWAVQSAAGVGVGGHVSLRAVEMCVYVCFLGIRKINVEG